MYKDKELLERITSIDLLKEILFHARAITRYPKNYTTDLHSEDIDFHAERIISDIETILGR